MRLRPSILAAALLGAVVAIVLAGCASAPIATAEEAPGAHLRQYPSFAFFEPLSKEWEGYGTMAGARAGGVALRNGIAGLPPRSGKPGVAHQRDRRGKPAG